MIFLYAVLCHVSAFAMIFLCRRLRHCAEAANPFAGLPVALLSAVCGFTGSTLFWASIIVALYGIVEAIR